MMMTMTFITRRGEGQGKTKKERKATKSKGSGLEEGASRALMRFLNKAHRQSCARSGRKDKVGEVKGVEMMGVLVAGRGAKERAGRRLEVEVDSKRRSSCHDVSNLILETVGESCAFGEDIGSVGLR